MLLIYCSVHWFETAYLYLSHIYAHLYYIYLYHQMRVFEWELLEKVKWPSELHTWDKKLPLLFFCSWGNPCDYEFGRKWLNLHNKALQPSFFMWQLYRATSHVETSVVTWWLFFKVGSWFKLFVLLALHFPATSPCHKLPPQSVLHAFVMGVLNKSWSYCLV